MWAGFICGRAQSDGVAVIDSRESFDVQTRFSHSVIVVRMLRFRIRRLALRTGSHFPDRWGEKPSPVISENILVARTDPDGSLHCSN